MDKQIFFDRTNVKSIVVSEDYSKKLKNFQLVPPLSIEQQIDRFTTAGLEMQKLAGLGVFDFNESQPIDDCLEDPTREPDYDLIDAAVTMRNLALKQQAAKAAGTLAESEGNNQGVNSDSSENKAENSSGATESQPVTETAQRS